MRRLGPPAAKGLSRRSDVRRSIGCETRSLPSAHEGFLADASEMRVVVQEQERDPPGRRLPRLLIGISKGRLFRIAPDQEQRVGFASGASSSCLGGVEVWTAMAAFARKRVAGRRAANVRFTSEQRTFDAHPVAGAAEAVGALVVE